VDLAEVIHDEVEKRGSGSCWSIVLSGLIEFPFGHFGLLDLLEKYIAVYSLFKPNMPSKNQLGLLV
jgi:hypothetical protein